MIRTFTRQVRSAAASAFLIALAACGGGGDDSAPSAAALPASAPVTALPTSIALTAPAAGIEPGTATSFTSDVPAGSKLAFSWDFGDGSGSSSDAVPSHTYAASGNYDISLTITNEAGASKTSTIHVSVANASNVKGLACSAPDEAGWCWQRPTPNGNAISDVFFASATTGWAVGEAGSILKTSNGGASWSSQISNTTANFYTARFVNERVGWALGANGTLLHSIDGGNHWTAQDFGAWYNFNPTALWVIDPSKLMLTDGYWQSSSSTDSGETWLASSPFSPVLVTPSGTLWSANFPNGVTKSSDLGKTVVTSIPWPGITPTQISFSDDLHGWVAGLTYWDGTPGGNQPVVLRTVDGGNHWQAAGAAPNNNAWTYIAFFTANQGWAAANYSGILRSTDAGNSWSSVALPPEIPSTATFYQGSIEALDANTLWFQWSNGAYLTVDGGAHWTLLSVTAELNPSYYDLPRLRRIDAHTLLLNYGQRYYRSADGGTSWQQVLGGKVGEAGSALQALWFFNAKQGLALSVDGFILRTADGGKSWDRKAVGPQPGCRSCGVARLQFLSATQGWLLLNGKPSTTTDGGLTWSTPLTPMLTSTMNDLYFIDAKRGWAVADTGGIYATTDGGTTWSQPSSPMQAYNSVRFANASLGLVVGSNGRISRTTDGGVTWSASASGTRQDLTRVTFVGADSAWAIGNGGTVSRSDDGGASWTLVPVPTFLTLHDITFADAQHGWIVGDGGTVLATSDGGISWAVQPSASVKGLYGVFAVDSRTAWVVGEGSSILATATGGSR